MSDEFVKGKFYNFAGGSSLSFRKNAIGAAHVFLLPFSGHFVFCDRALRDAVLEAGIGSANKSDGVWFLDAADC
jgi:hypothetical protein